MARSLPLGPPQVLSQFIVENHGVVPKSLSKLRTAVDSGREVGGRRRQGARAVFATPHAQNGQSMQPSSSPRAGLTAGPDREGGMEKAQGGILSLS